jgi:hypothetical protein
MTAVTAASDNPELAYSNAVGGIAAQTTAIAVADLVYWRANLEHAAAGRRVRRCGADGWGERVARSGDRDRRGAPGR